MNRREFLKKSLGGIIIGSIPLISGCSKNPVTYELKNIFVDKELVADAFGNSDGFASKDESDDIEKYFMSNNEAWGLGGFAYHNEDYYNINEIPLSDVINTLKIHGLGGPHRSEAELRNDLKGGSIKTPSLGVYVFVQVYGISDKYRIKYYYKAPGLRISEQKWTSIIILQ